MADTDTNGPTGKPQNNSAAETAARSGADTSPNVARAEAQAGDPYRPAGGNDYSLSIEPEDTGEATVANLFQAVPLENEGTGAAQQGGEGLNGDGGSDGGVNAGSPGDGLNGHRDGNRSSS